MTTESFYRDMQKKIESGALPSDYLERFAQERIERRAIYGSPRGIRELAHLISYSGVLSKVDASDPVSIGAHNLCIDMLDDMGLLDEANLEELVRFMLSSPAVPGMRAEKE